MTSKEAYPRQAPLKGRRAEVSGPCNIMVVTDACEIDKTCVYGWESQWFMQFSLFLFAFCGAHL
jgi:hypothetical protein